MLKTSPHSGGVGCQQGQAGLIRTGPAERVGEQGRARARLAALLHALEIPVMNWPRLIVEARPWEPPAETEQGDLSEAPYRQSRSGWLHWVCWPLRNGVHQLSGSKYQVALSFAGEQRWYVEEVARNLKDQGVSVFYDLFEKKGLWGRNLAEAFHEVFSRAEYVVIFISQDYASKWWPRYELRSALDRMIQR